jgi:hypothetical protein
MSGWTGDAPALSPTQRNTPLTIKSVFRCVIIIAMCVTTLYINRDGRRTTV